MTIDAGNDTVFCQQMNPVSFSIGGMPTVSNGSPPYTFEWSIKEPYHIPFSSIIMHAQDFLDDTTLANPTIIDGFGVLDSLKFYLKVVDSVGTTIKDSIRVGFSIFGVGLENNYFYIFNGDTLFVPFASYVNGGLGSLSYLWQPNNGLIDSTFNHLWTSPSVSTDYFCTVTDGFGCSITTIVMNHVIVNYLNLENLTDKSKNPINLFPNPTDGKIYIKYETNNLKNMCIYDAEMRLLDQFSSLVENYDLSNFKKGVYFLTFEFEEEIISKKIVLK